MAIKTKLCVVLILGMTTLPTFMFSQTLYDGYILDLPDIHDTLMLEEVSEYTAFDFPIATLNHELKRNREASVTVRIKIDTLYDWLVTFEENEIRSGNYLLAQSTDNGVILRHKSKEVNTYKGHVDGDTTQWIRFFVSDTKMSGLLNDQGKMYRIEQVYEIIPDTNYVSTLVIGEELFWQLPTAPLGGCAASAEPYPDTLLITQRDGKERFLELATEVDYQFFLLKNGGNPLSDTSALIGNVEDEVLEIINMVDGIYTETFDLRVQLVYQNIWITDNDPYSCCGIEDMWWDFKDYWEDEKDCVHKDAVAMMSGQDLNRSGVVVWQGEDSVCGFPQPGTCPGDDTYYSVTRGDDWKVVAHEIGHNFGLKHVCKCTIMNGDLVGCNLFCESILPEFDDSTTVSRMNSHLQGTEVRCIGDQILLAPNDVCLEDSALINYEFDILLEPSLVVLGEVPFCDTAFTVTFTNAFGTSNIEWELGPGLTLTSGTLTDTTVSLSASTEGTTHLDVKFNYNCEDITFRREFNIGTPSAPKDADLRQLGQTGFYYVKLADPVVGASHYDVTWTHTNPYGFTYSSLPQPYYTSPTHDPIAEPDLENGSVFHMEVAAVNTCGQSDFLVVDWVLYNAGGNGSNNILVDENEATEGAQSPSDLGPTKTIKHFSLEELMAQKEGLNLGIEEGTYGIYPNPARQHFFVLMPPTPDTKKINCYDMTGRLCHSQELSGKIWRYEVGTEGWTEGMYVVEIETDGEKKILKVLIQ